jgi:hypothetical protein
MPPRAVEDRAVRGDERSATPNRFLWQVHLLSFAPIGEHEDVQARVNEQFSMSRTEP